MISSKSFIFFILIVLFILVSPSQESDSFFQQFLKEEGFFDKNKCNCPFRGERRCKSWMETGNLKCTQWEDEETCKERDVPVCLELDKQPQNECLEKTKQCIKLRFKQVPVSCAVSSKKCVQWEMVANEKKCELEELVCAEKKHIQTCAEKGVRCVKYDTAPRNCDKKEERLCKVMLIERKKQCVKEGGKCVKMAKKRKCKRWKTKRVPENKCRCVCTSGPCTCQETNDVPITINVNTSQNVFDFDIFEEAGILFTKKANPKCTPKYTYKEECEEWGDVEEQCLEEKRECLKYKIIKTRKCAERESKKECKLFNKNRKCVKWSKYCKRMKIKEVCHKYKKVCLKYAKEKVCTKWEDKCEKYNYEQVADGCEEEREICKKWEKKLVSSPVCKKWSEKKCDPANRKCLNWDVEKVCTSWDNDVIWRTVDCPCPDCPAKCTLMPQDECANDPECTHDPRCCQRDSCPEECHKLPKVACLKQTECASVSNCCTDCPEKCKMMSTDECNQDLECQLKKCCEIPTPPLNETESKCPDFCAKIPNELCNNYYECAKRDCCVPDKPPKCSPKCANIPLSLCVNDPECGVISLDCCEDDGEECPDYCTEIPIHQCNKDIRCLRKSCCRYCPSRCAVVSRTVCQTDPDCVVNDCCHQHECPARCALLGDECDIDYQCAENECCQSNCPEHCSELSPDECIADIECMLYPDCCEIPPGPCPSYCSEMSYARCNRDPKCSALECCEPKCSNYCHNTTYYYCVTDKNCKNEEHGFDCCEALKPKCGDHCAEMPFAKCRQDPKCENAAIELHCCQLKCGPNCASLSYESCLSDPTCEDKQFGLHCCKKPEPPPTKPTPQPKPPLVDSDPPKEFNVPELPEPQIPNLDHCCKKPEPPPTKPTPQPTPAEQAGCKCPAYPLYKQNDPRWGSKILGTKKTSTIAKHGCLMSSIAMALAGKGITINGQTANPDNLNEWLKKNGGYASGNLFVWASVNKLGLKHSVHYTTDKNALAAAVKKCNVVILNVDGSSKGSHYVLATGAGNGVFYINDPYFEKNQIPFSAAHKGTIYTGNWKTC